MPTTSQTADRSLFINAAQLYGHEEEFRQQFQNAQPYAHLVIDDFLLPEIAEKALAEFEVSSGQWTFLHHINEKKRQLTRVEQFGSVTQALVAELQSPGFVSLVERMTGIERLIPDPELDGSGLHETMAGGFLNMHVDFLSHVIRKTWSRQLNLLIYLNKDWKDEYHGHFELWNQGMTECVKKIAPKFNRCVLFHTSTISWHGHPAPLACPPERSRRSIALYYYRDEGKVVGLSSTDYRPTPGQSLKSRSLIAADRFALRVYSLLKRYAGLRDDVVSRILKHF